MTRGCEISTKADRPDSVADTHFGVGQVINGEVFPKLSVREIGAAEFALPVSVGIHLVNHDGKIQASMAKQVSLAVTVYVKPSGHDTAQCWIFPDTGADGLAMPRQPGRRFAYRLS